MDARKAKRIADKVNQIPKLLESVFAGIETAAKAGYYKCVWCFPAKTPLSDEDESSLYIISNILSDRFYGFETSTGKCGEGKKGNLYISWENVKPYEYQKGDLDRRVVKEVIEKSYLNKEKEKMKIYAVYDIFSKEVFGVFKTYEGARNYINNESSMTSGERNSCEIQEWEMGD